MTEERLNELLAEVLSGLTDEQKEQCKACADLKELMALAGKLGFALPDELLDAAAGGGTPREYLFGGPPYFEAEVPIARPDPRMTNFF